jgi:hypothetical protein
MSGVRALRLAAAIALAALLALLATREAGGQPDVVAFTPQSGPPGTLVKIIGAGLSSLGGVEFGGADATFRVVADNHVKAEVPETATTGPIRVWSATGDASTDVPFVVLRPELVPERPALAPPRPNPARGSVTSRFSLPRDSRARLAILDAGGRLRRTLVDEWVRAGPSERTWDGLDQRGRLAPSGVYFGRLEVEGERIAQPVVWVR